MDVAVPRTAVLEIHGGHDGAGHARHWLRGALGVWEVPEDLLDRCSSLVGELVANALVHGAPPVVLELRLSADALLVEVSDAGAPLPPRRAAAGEDAESGRGLELMDSLADVWGSRDLDAGKVVWAELRL